MNPYRFLFPLGLLHAILGGLYWVGYALGFLPYPGVEHAHEMFTGFLLSYASGFLLTAIPRFTGSPSCSRIELAIAISASSLTFFIHDSWLTLFTLLFLVIFVLRRFKSSGFAPPPHFIFLPVGLLLGISSSTALTVIDAGLMDGRYILPARLLLYSGTMLAFILGIGAKLIAALLGWTPVPVHQIQSLKTQHPARAPINFKKITPHLQAALFVISFGVEIGLHPGIGKGLRALCATWIAFHNWKIYRRPLATGKLAFWIWVTAWLLILGLWTQSIFPEFGVHAAHLVFIMGYGLVTLMVASRVILAHGGYSLEHESKSRVYALFSTALIIAALTRFTAPWTPSYTQHLGYAAGVWVIGVIIWGVYFTPKALKHQDSAHSTPG